MRNEASNALSRTMCRYDIGDVERRKLLEEAVWLCWSSKEVIDFGVYRLISSTCVVSSLHEGCGEDVLRILCEGVKTLNRRSVEAYVCDRKEELPSKVLDTLLYLLGECELELCFEVDSVLSKFWNVNDIEKIFEQIQKLSTYFLYH